LPSSAGIASGMGIFGVSRYIAVPLGAALVWYVIVQGSYRPVGKRFSEAPFFYSLYTVLGEMRNGTAANVVAVSTTVAMIVLTAMMLWTSLAG
jgi:hypothetical protein